MVSSGGSIFPFQNPDKLEDIGRDPEQLVNGTESFDVDNIADVVWQSRCQQAVDSPWWGLQLGETWFWYCL